MTTDTAVEFNLELALAGAPLVSRCGAKVINFQHDPSGQDGDELNYSYDCIENGHTWHFYVTKEGVCLPRSCERRDLFMEKSEAVPVTEEVTA